MKSSQNELVAFLLKSFGRLLDSPNDAQQTIATSVCKFAQATVDSGRDKVLDQEVREIIYGCLDLDHWNDKRMPPQMSLEDVRSALNSLRQILANSR